MKLLVRIPLVPLISAPVGIYRSFFFSHHCCVISCGYGSPSQKSFRSANGHTFNIAVLPQHYCEVKQQQRKYRSAHCVSNKAVHVKAWTEQISDTALKRCCSGLQPLPLTPHPVQSAHSYVHISSHHLLNKFLMRIMIK